VTISAKVKRAYKDLRSFAGENHPLEPLADAFRHERAMRKKEKWDHSHRCADNLDWKPGSRLCADPCHVWTYADWEEEVEQELTD